MYSPWYISPSEYDSNGSGQFSVSAIGLSGEITSTEYDFGYTAYSSSDFVSIDGVCTFTSPELTCPKKAGEQCGYSVTIEYQDGRTLVQKVTPTANQNAEFVFYPVRNYM